MDKKLIELQNNLASTTGRISSLIEVGESESRDLSDDEQRSLDGLFSEAEKLKAKIAQREKLAELEKNQILAAPPSPSPKATGDGSPKGVADLMSSPAVRAVPTIARRHGKLRAFPNTREGEFEAYSTGMALYAGVLHNPRALEWCKNNGIAERALSGGINTKGGALVMDEFTAAVIRNVEDYGVARQNMRVVPMGSDVVHEPRRTGGLTVYYPGEGGTITTSDAAYDTVTLTAKTPSTLTAVSIELSEDAVISVIDELTTEVAQAFALDEDNSAFIGDGTSTYGGSNGAAVKINDGNHAASIYTAASGNTGFSTLDLADFEGLVGQTPNYVIRGGNARWYISQVGFYASMVRLADASGGTTKGEIEGQSRLQVLGFPVEIVQVLNSTVGADVSKIKCLFGDLRRSSMFGDRRLITVETDNSVYFASAQMAVRGTQRYDVNNHSLGDGSTAGPLGALKTPGS